MWGWIISIALIAIIAAIVAWLTTKVSISSLLRSHNSKKEGSET